MSFVIKSLCWINTMKVGDKIKGKLNTKFHSIPVYDKQYKSPK